jgi:hypothetical protein
MTINWQALEEHFLMVPLFFQFNYFRGKMHFLNFSQKTSVLKSSDIDQLNINKKTYLLKLITS